MKPWRRRFIKTTYDISLDSQISFLPLGFSPTIYLSSSTSKRFFPKFGMVIEEEDQRQDERNVIL